MISRSAPFLSINFTVLGIDQADSVTWDGGFSVVNDSPLPLVCFTHPAIARGGCSVDELVARVLARGRVWISAARLTTAGPQVLRACITNHRTQVEDVRVLVGEVAQALPS